jgi:hypothetical protein
MSPSNAIKIVAMFAEYGITPTFASQGVSYDVANIHTLPRSVINQGWWFIGSLVYSTSSLNSIYLAGRLPHLIIHSTLTDLTTQASP